ncbi:MAG TPA: S41 family peptidase [Steroidobacteraceae bacterium]|nr:S41 family peptidase [Steroidobacteraceae bacterium]
MRRFARMPLLLGTVTVFLILAAACMSKAGDGVVQRRAVLLQAWKTVGDHYYDPQMNGFDWTAVRATFERRLPKAKNSFELYWKILRPMMRLLESSHVQVTMPAAQSGQSDQGRPQASSQTWNLEACAGLWISQGRPQLLSRVEDVDPDSLLYAAGVRTNWRLVGLQERGARVNPVLAAKFITTSGEQADVTLAPRMGGRPPAAKLVKRDFSELQELLISHADPATRLRLEALGISVSLGQTGTLPFVVDVERASKAERAGIEPGSELIEWSTSHVTDGGLHFSARLTSGKREYSAEFDFASCDTRQLSAARIAEKLPGNVLYLRFGGFDAGLIQWIDEQLRARPSAVVLDLRRNGGGDAAVLLEFMGRFLDPGTLVARATYPDRSETWGATESPFVFRGPLAVLTGPMSASAAEVCASALRFHGRASLHGRSTRGSVQLSESYPLPDGGSVRVATADVRDPAGRPLEGVGIRLDQSVVPTLIDVRAGRDVALESALRALGERLR